MNTAGQESEYMKREGYSQITMDGLESELSAIGYRLDRSMDSKSTARWITGERAGQSYPSLTMKPVQSDNGICAFNTHARRDANYRRLTEIRNTFYVVVGGYIATI